MLRLTAPVELCWHAPRLRQAKFYAPESMKSFVAARAGENAEVDLPDNNS
jgi:hypothetical protein